MDLNQVLYSIFRAEFESGSKIGPKPPQDPIFKDFLKIMIFIKIRFLSIFIGAAASAGGPFKYITPLQKDPKQQGTSRKRVVQYAWGQTGRKIFSGHQIDFMFISFI